MSDAGLLGACIRSLPWQGEGPKPLYLTFDDGPDPTGTAATLAVLKDKGVAATFFVVAERAKRHPALLRQLVDEGHAVGNHSLDHTWNAYFARRATMRRWIAASEQLLTSMLGHPTVGFRSPAGVRTPPLAWALRDLNLPLIHWNVRFFDRARRWRADAAVSSLRRTAPGSIVLLHDRQRPAHLDAFQRTLAAYIDAAVAQGFAPRAITSAALRAPERR